MTWKWAADVERGPPKVARVWTGVGARARSGAVGRRAGRVLTGTIAVRRRHPSELAPEPDSVGLVAALGPDLTGRIHHAYRRSTDRRWWRRWRPGWSIPRLDYVSLCGREGLVLAEPPQPVDCGACRRILASRNLRARRLGA